MGTAATLEPKTTEQNGTAGNSTQPLTHEAFVHHMKAMAVHYKTSNTGTGGATHTYQLPVSVLHPVDQEGAIHNQAVPAGAGKDAMDRVLNDGQTKLKSFAQQQHDFVQQQANKLQGSHDTANFAAQMNAQRSKAKQESDKHIDDMYDKLTTLGKDHPELQQHILSATQKLGAFITSLLASVVSFFTNIFNKIVGWINSAVDWVKGAAETAGKWLAGAAKSIGHFFSSLF